MRRKAKPTITKLKKKLWELCKQITRKRHGMNCYTCGVLCEAPHTAHFIPSSVCSVEVRYALENLRPCCYRCNINLSGNWPAYEAHLIADHGQKYVDDLKRRNNATKGGMYRNDWYEAKIAEYTALLGR